MSVKQIIIGSRGSQLALWQANLVKSLIFKFYPEVRIGIQIIKTSGDIFHDAPLAKIGDKGLFTKEIEQALLGKQIDLAVHSMKDLPTSLPDGLAIGAILEREDPRDAFLSTKFNQFDELPPGAVVATSSLRRQANILHLRPDIQLADIRGNVDTRLRKMKEQGYDGMLLAAAGLLRLGYSDEIREIIATEKMLPAVSQGALGVEIRVEDTVLKSILAPLHDPKTGTAIMAERAFLRKLEGGCQIPIGALAQLKQGRLELQGFISDLQAKKFLRGSSAGKVKDAEHIGINLAQQLLEQGGREILAELRTEVAREK